VDEFLNRYFIDSFPKGNSTKRLTMVKGEFTDHPTCLNLVTNPDD